VVSCKFDKLIKYCAFLVLLLGVGFISILVMTVVNVNQYKIRSPVNIETIFRLLSLILGRRLISSRDRKSYVVLIYQVIHLL